MTIDWPNFAVGALSGAFLTAICDWQIGARIRKWSELRRLRRALTKDYGALAGHYVNYNVGDHGRHVPTGGTIEITWEPKHCLLKATGLHPGGVPDWYSDIKMSMEFKWTGTGHYHEVGSIHSGIQQVMYFKQTRTFSVMGTSHIRKEFTHHWKLKE
jgi:hypothetical protein